MKRQYDLLHTASLSPVDEDDALFLKTEYKVVRILAHNILYVEGMSEYLRIHLAAASQTVSDDRTSAVPSKPIVVLFSMKKMEERLADKDFMRIHKSYIVNLHHIAEIQRGHILLDDGIEVPVGDSYRDALNAYVSGKFLGK